MSSEKDGESELEKNANHSPTMRRNPMSAEDVPADSTLEIPASVQDIISRIERAQAVRATENIKTQMSEIMSNVHRIMARYNLDFDLPSRHSISLTEHLRKQRSLFLERMGTYSKNVENREKTLAYILAWLEEWNVILSDITAFDVEEHYHSIVQMEMFPETLRAIENNVNILCRISTTFLNDKKTQKKKIVSRGTLWKTWKDRFIKRPATALALRPDQMISDQFTTNTKVLEIQRMLQELIGSSMFNKMEKTAIKYISATILNLSKALSAVCEQVNVSNIISDSMFFEKYETEKELSRRMICDLSEQNELLQRKLQEKEEYTSMPTSRTNIKAGDIADSMDNISAKELENTLYKSPTKEITSSEIKWGSSLLLKAPAVLTPDLPGQQYHPPEDHQQMGPGTLEGTAELKTPGPMKHQEEKKEKLSQGLKTERQLELNTNTAPPFTESSPPGAPPIYPQPHPKYKSLTPLKTQALMTTLTPQQAQALGTTLTTQQAEALMTTLTPQQAEALMTTLTPQETQALEKTLTTQEVQALETTLDPQQAQALGTTLAPHHTQTQGAHLTPDKALPTPGQPLELEVLRPKQDFPQTARPPPAMKAPLTPRWPIKSRTTSISTKSPGLHGPLSPGQSLAPGPSSFPGEFLESGPSSAQPPAHQPPVSTGKPPALQAPSALAEHLAPPTLPGETSRSRIAPSSVHPSTSRTPSAAGMPQNSIPSSGRKKGLVRIASQKLVQPSPPGRKRDLTPFIASKPSPETQTPQDSSPMELQSHLASDSIPTSGITYTDEGTLHPLQKPKTSLPSLAPQLTPASRVPFTNEGVLHSRQRSRMALPPITPQQSPLTRVPFTNEEMLHTRQKPRTSLPSATPQPSRTSQKPLSQRASKSQYPSLDKPWFMKPVSDINKDKLMVPPSSPKELEARMYFVDVEAQRKNLMLLNQALTSNGLPSQLHTTARNLIIETLHTDQVRLGYLFHKYTAYRMIQRSRNYIIHRVKATQNTGKGFEMQKLYVMLSKIDDYQKRVMHVWTEKQKLLEEKRNQCLRKMITLFNQLQETYKLNLSRPNALISHKKEIPSSSESVQQTFQQPPTEEDT